MKELHIICCNDMIMHAVSGKEETARSKLEELREAYYEKCKGSYEGRVEYDAICFWHLHTLMETDVTVEPIPKLTGRIYVQD